MKFFFINQQGKPLKNLTIFINLNKLGKRKEERERGGEREKGKGKGKEERGNITPLVN